MDYTVKDAAAELGLSGRQVMNLIEAGVLQARKVGDFMYLIDGESLQKEKARRMNLGKRRRLPRATDDPSAERAAEPAPSYHTDSSKPKAPEPPAE